MKTPTVNIQGGRAENRQQINLPNSQPFITTERERAAGNIGLNFEAPSTVQGQPTVFGVDASGQYMLGQSLMQRYGLPRLSLNMFGYAKKSFKQNKSIKIFLFIVKK